MKLYAIRNKISKLYLPGNMGNGHTFLEPISIDKPRLHFSKKSAQNALTAWCKGRYEKRYEGGTNILEIDFDTWSRVWVKQEHRKREDMEIVEFDLIEY